MPEKLKFALPRRCSYRNRRYALTKYIAVVQQPKEYAEDANSTRRNLYPIVIEIPELPSVMSPDEWVRNNVLPQHSGSVVTVYKSGPVFVPATHKLENEGSFEY